MNDGQIQKGIIKRFTVVYMGIVFFSVAIIGRIVYLQFFEREKWNKAQETTLKEMTIAPGRGDICATDGRVLACSIPYYEVRWDTRCESVSEKYFYKSVDSLALGLSRLFGDFPKSEYRRQLVSARNRGERYYLLKRHVSYEQLKKMKTFPIFRMGQYKGGFIYVRENKRVQPFGNLAARTIGYTTESGTIVGIEGSFNKELKGEMGIRMMQKIAGGIWMPVNDGGEIEPEDGLDVVTTLDINIQDVAHAALQKQLIRHNCSHGSAILMEVKTGEVKAIVNLARAGEGNYVEKYNFALGESTEPGSTFKLASLMAALEDGYIELDDTVDTGHGKAKINNWEVRDSKEEGYGRISIQNVFEVSSNVGVCKLIYKHYKGKERRFIDRIYSMGLNEKMGLQVLGETPPYIKYPGDPLWSGVSLIQMAYGYEMQLTPLQILTFYNAVANNGKMVKPKFVRALSEHGKIVKTYGTEVINSSICSRSTIKKARRMLEGVVERGTAMNLRNPNYKIAGKTGTAQLAKGRGGYKSKGVVTYQASFAGYFPADNPKYSCIVVISSPSNAVYYGNIVAGPVFKEIADKVYSTNIDLQLDNAGDEKQYVFTVPATKAGNRKELSYLLDYFGIPNNSDDLKSDWVGTEKSEKEVKCFNRYSTQNLVPNVRGMGLRDALQVLELNGLSVSVIGRGFVSRQSLQPGSRCFNGSHIVIELS